MSRPTSEQATPAEGAGPDVTSPGVLTEVLRARSETSDVPALRSLATDR